MKKKKKTTSKKAQGNGKNGAGNPTNQLRGTNPPDADDDDPRRASRKARAVKGIALAHRKPSYCLKVGIGHPNQHRDGESIRSFHARRLRLLLKKLLRKHNWAEASGVLGVLLQGTSREKSISRIRRKYWAALELLQRIKGDKINKRKMRLVCDLRIKKLGSMKMPPTKERFSAQWDFIIFCLRLGDTEDAYQAALCLTQEHGFDSDPVSNLVVGLAYFQLWYSGIPKEMQLGDLSQTASPMQLDTSEDGFQLENLSKSATPGQSQMSAGIICMSIDGHDAIEAQRTNVSLKCDSNTSVGNGKDDINVDVKPIRQVPMDVDDNAQTKTPCYIFGEQDFYMNSAERSGRKEPSFRFNNDDLPRFSIFYTNGLPLWLLPLQLPYSPENLEDFIYMHRNSLNDHYKDAVKYLRAALYLDPPALEAFHPLIQMLLVGDQVEEALDEVEKFIGNPCTALQLRLKTSLFEYFDNSNNAKLSAHIEDLLEKDPSCCRSLEKLVNFHSDGYYSTEKLVEMIGLHLDATLAECNTWRVFASCLLNLSCSEGDRLSASSDGDGKKKYSYNINQIPAIFSNPESLHTWRLRCRWWQKRHYSRKTLESEIAAGELPLMTYKAATACHLYGREFGYVGKASEHLERETMSGLLSFLRIHIQNSVGFYFSLDRGSV